MAVEKTILSSRQYYHQHMTWLVILRYGFVDGVVGDPKPYELPCLESNSYFKKLLLKKLLIHDVKLCV